MHTLMVGASYYSVIQPDPKLPLIQQHMCSLISSPWPRALQATLNGVCPVLCPQRSSRGRLIKPVLTNLIPLSNDTPVMGRTYSYNYLGELTGINSAIIDLTSDESAMHNYSLCSSGKSKGQTRATSRTEKPRHVDLSINDDSAKKKPTTACNGETEVKTRKQRERRRLVIADDNSDSDCSVAKQSKPRAKQMMSEEKNGRERTLSSEESRLPVIQDDSTDDEGRKGGEGGAGQASIQKVLHQRTPIVSLKRVKAIMTSSETITTGKGGNVGKHKRTKRRKSVTMPNKKKLTGERGGERVGSSRTAAVVDNLQSSQRLDSGVWKLSLCLCMYVSEGLCNRCWGLFRSQSNISERIWTQ